eukprot:15774188-Heterocapsa_arctica.AAC.1
MGTLRGSTSLAEPRRPSAPARLQPGTSTSAAVPGPWATRSLNGRTRSPWRTRLSRGPRRQDQARP